jgi:exopolyphosphatase/guanosine-5'-triphosphate,3'-diphosphate pyrophosphatase
MKHLSPGAIERAIDTLELFRVVAESWDAEIAAVATSATREALNRQEFLDRARDEAGIEIAVISGMEEARLIHLGVLQAVPVYDDNVLVIDVGRESTELIVGSGDRMRAARSLKLGSIRLTNRFLAAEPATDAAIDACRAYVRAFLSTVVRKIKQAGFSTAVEKLGHARQRGRDGRRATRRAATLTQRGLRHAR